METDDIWDYKPIDAERQGVSFSYIRADTGANQLYHGEGVGIIFLPLNQISDKQQKYNIYCHFPTNAMTIFRSNHGCGDELPNPMLSADSSTCESRGVYSGEQWVANYYSIWNKDIHKACSFSGTNPRGMLEAITAQELNNTEPANTLPKNLWNEIVLSNWNRNSIETIPIEAIWFDDATIGAPFEDKLKASQKAQTSYHDRTGKILPILRYHIGSTTLPFSYVSTDQIYKD